MPGSRWCSLDRRQHTRHGIDTVWFFAYPIKGCLGQGPSFICMGDPVTFEIAQYLVACGPTNQLRLVSKRLPIYG